MDAPDAHPAVRGRRGRGDGRGAAGDPPPDGAGPVKRKTKTRGLGCLAGLILLLAAAWAVRSEPAVGPVGGWMAQAGVEPAFVDVGGVRVRYVRKGTGPAVVLIHGFASSIFTWKDVLPVLAETHDVVALDLPGFGGSEIPRPLAGSTYPGVAFAVMDRLGVERAALVGNSLAIGRASCR